MVARTQVERFVTQRPSLWVTRRRPKIDRVACPWLIRRFIDAGGAHPVRRSARGAGGRRAKAAAVPFDIEGVELSHEGPRCTFDTMLKLFGLETEPSLARLALIVRGADTARPDIAPEAAGLHAISLGLSALAGDDDHGMLRHGFMVYDALFAWLRFAAEERHNWPAKAACLTMTTDRRICRDDFPPALRRRASPRRSGSGSRSASSASAGRPARSPPCIASWSTRRNGSTSRASCTRSISACCCRGPEAQQLATYVGWLLHRTIGGLAAGLLFILPGALVMLGLSFIYVLARGVPVIDGALFGIKAAVLVIVVEAIIRIGRRGLKSWLLVSLAAAAFVAIFFFELPFPLIVIGAGLIGFLVAQSSPQHLGLKDEVEAAATPASAELARCLPARSRPGSRCGGRRSRWRR